MFHILQCTGVLSFYPFFSFYTFETTQCLGCFWTGSSPSICWSQSWSWLVLERVCIFWSRVFRMPTSGAPSHWGTSRWLKQGKHTAEMTTATPCYDGTCVDVCAKSCIDATSSESIVFSQGFFSFMQSDYRAKRYNTLQKSIHYLQWLLFAVNIVMVIKLGSVGNWTWYAVQSVVFSGDKLNQLNSKVQPKVKLIF